MSQLAKEGIWLKAMVNNVAVDTFVDSGSKYFLIDFDFWKRICMGREPNVTFVQLVGAGGEKLPVVGKSKVWLNLGNQSFELSVIIIQQFKFDLLFGDEFLRKKMILDYGKNVVKIGGDEVTFEPLPSACVAFLRSVVELPVGSPVCGQAGLLGNHCGLTLFGGCQLVKTDERVLVAPVITKVDGNNSVWLELVNTTRSPVILQSGTKVQHCSLLLWESTLSMTSSQKKLGKLLRYP